MCEENIDLRAEIREEKIKKKTSHLSKSVGENFSKTVENCNNSYLYQKHNIGQVLGDLVYVFIKTSDANTSEKMKRSC